MRWIILVPEENGGCIAGAIGLAAIGGLIWFGASSCDFIGRVSDGYGPDVTIDAKYHSRIIGETDGRSRYRWGYDKSATGSSHKYEIDLEPLSYEDQDELPSDGDIGRLSHHLYAGIDESCEYAIRVQPDQPGYAETPGGDGRVSLLKIRIKLAFTEGDDEKKCNYTGLADMYDRESETDEEDHRETVIEMVDGPAKGKELVLPYDGDNCVFDLPIFGLRLCFE